MLSLSPPLYTFIARAINTHGTYNPSVISYLFEEDLTSNQWNNIIPFLQWCHDNDKTFGKGNYNERYREFLNR